MRSIINKYLIILGVLLIPFTAIDAKTVKKAPTAEELLAKAEDAFYDYDFEEAEDLLEQYKKLLAKAKKPVPEDVEELEARMVTASNAFDRVQKVVVLDSISVPRTSFFKSYKLTKSAGQIGYPSDFKLENVSNAKELGYLAEDGDYFVSVAPDRFGYLRLKENDLLLDGKWFSREALEGDFEKTGDYAFPFMSGDGQTLYFANNGEESIGGYDLFIAQKDPISGEYRQPLNLGMPFNSPYDDIMMVMDEEKGVGWWATDRNSPEGDITVYVFLIEDVRRNYPSDTENLVDLAKLTDFKSTWEPGKEKSYRDKLKQLVE